MAGLKTRYKIAGVAILVGVGLFGLRAGMQSGLIPTPSLMKAMVPQKADIATLGGNIQMKPSQTYDLAATPDASPPQRTLAMLPWQGGGSLVLANGGAGDASGTLMQKYAGANLKLVRNDNYTGPGSMAEQFLKFANGYKAGQANPEGYGYVQIMGDGGPAFFAGIKPELDKLGLHAVGFAVTGFSHGEDKCMAPDTGGDPQKAKGDLIAASPRDGDWNICIKYAADNGIPVNSDTTSYDKNALNFMDVGGFTDADDKFISGACEDLNEVNDGVKTGKKVHVCVNGVATWTPGDVDVVTKGKTPLVTLASTKDYDQQMPALIIGIKEDLQAHPQFVTGMLKAIDRASFQIRTTPDGVQKMADAEAKVFGTSGGDEATGAYWARYFNGVDSPDGKVKLGGSRVSTLAEVRDFLGLGNGTLDIFKGVYKVFGDADVKFYPTVVPNYPAYADIIDTDFITQALQGVTMGAPTTTQFATAQNITTAVSKRAVSVTFETGTAKLSPASRATLEDIANQSGMTNLLIRIDGFTDNTGDPDANVNLSRARAQAVADALTKMAPATFPATRMQVRGFGSDQPVGDNTTSEGRAANRRVEITLGS